jgi:hypothetical protein
MITRLLPVWRPVAASALFMAYPAHAALTSGQNEGVSIWRVAGALLLCLGLAAAGALIIKMRSGGGPIRPPFTVKGRRLELQENLRISPQVQLSIVTCDGRSLLFATSPQGAQLVRELDVALGHENKPA